MESVIHTDLGLVGYKECWELQQKFFEALIAAKSVPGSAISQSARLLLCEHPHVYTLGKSGHAENLLVNETFLARIGAELFRIDRGGDITYHGPGRLVGYPILDLQRLNLGLKEYVHALEQCVIDTIADFGVHGGRVAGATGVWLGDAVPQEGTESATGGPLRKICAIGVRSSRFVTMHGFALNVNTQLDYFGYINPCGFTDRGVTSLEKELGHKVKMKEVKASFARHFEKIINIKIINNNEYANSKTLGYEGAGGPPESGSDERCAGDRTRAR